MSKIPFTLEAWLKDKSQKVVDEDGRPVRIICTDADGLYPIIGLVDNKTPLPCGKDGRPPYIGGGGGVLFIVTPEEEMTEFEIALENFVMNADASEQTFHEDVKQHAAELIDLARKELIKEGTSKNEMGTMLYDAGFEDGKAEALKDLPRWESNLKSYKVDEDDVIGPWLYYKEHCIRISDLEKLPGFKED